MSSHEAAQAALNVIFNPTVTRALAIQELFGGQADDDIIALAQWRKANPEAWSKLRAGKAAVVPLHERFGPMLVKDGRMDKPGEPGGAGDEGLLTVSESVTMGPPYTLHLPPSLASIESLLPMEVVPKDGSYILLAIKTEPHAAHFVLARHSTDPGLSDPWTLMEFTNSGSGCSACGTSGDPVRIEGFWATSDRMLGWLPWPVVLKDRPFGKEF
jgi:hypothetical protein